MKKLLAALLAALTLALPLIGCGGGSGGGQGGYVSVAVWHYYNGDQKKALDDLVADFNRTVGADKGIVVTAESLGRINDLRDAVISAAQNEPGARKLPDAFMSYSDTAYVMDKLIGLAPLSSYLSEAELSSYVDGYINEGKLDGGEPKIFPVAKATEVIVLNNDVWKEFETEYNLANPDSPVSKEDFSTVERLTDLALKYKDFTGSALMARDALANYLLGGARQLGKELYSVSEGKATLSLDKPTLKKLWDNYYVPYIKGGFSLDGSFGTDGISNGKIIAAIGSSTSSTYFPSKVLGAPEESPNIEMTALPAPIFENGDPAYIQQGAGMCVVKSDSAKEKACFEFLKWFTEAERNIGFCAFSGYLPVKKQANDIAKIKSVVEQLEINLPAYKKANILKTLEVAVGMVSNSGNILYTNSPFARSAEVRDELDKLKNLCKSDAAALKELDPEEISGRIAILEEELVKLDPSDTLYEQKQVELAELRERLTAAPEAFASKKAALLSPDYFDAWFSALETELTGFTAETPQILF